MKKELATSTTLYGHAVKGAVTCLREMVINLVRF